MTGDTGMQQLYQVALGAELLDFAGMSDCQRSGEGERHPHILAFSSQMHPKAVILSHVSITRPREWVGTGGPEASAPGQRWLLQCSDTPDNLRLAC